MNEYSFVALRDRPELKERGADKESASGRTIGSMS